ncbi:MULTISPECIES: acyl-CoA thioesterase II [unclassified Nocardia]|uniref:acyl-CoA thioesterase n=1 Tax=unclassified Nocardia TaxID=2637762 RepID=UPI001CE48A01|nr:MULTISPECIES: acyl-CoA thioesterase domain-containing protein [unclassified Nocardia]
MVHLIDTIALEPLDDNVFRSAPKAGTTPARVFGGEIAAKAVAAAAGSIGAEFAIHSLHGYFVRPGDPESSIDFEVEAVRDGRTFALRHVVARQGDRDIFVMNASYHVGDKGVRHADPAPMVPAPEAIARFGPAEPGHAWLSAIGLDDNWEIRRIPDGLTDSADGPHTRQQVWLRYTHPLPDDPVLHSCALAYASDITLLGAALTRHNWVKMQTAALDYSIWFLRPCRIDDWLLYDEASPSADFGRAFTNGRVFDRDGRLVAMVAQERMLRLVDAV